MTKKKAAKKDFLDLRIKREALGLTLKDVFRLTRISVVNLEAIENGDFHDLPVPIYTKNFIKTYARALNLDSKPILDSYEDYLKSLQIAQTQIPETVQGKEPLIKGPIYYKYIAAVSVIIAVVIIFVISWQLNRPASKVTGKQPEVVAVVPQVSVTTPVTPPEQTKAAIQPVGVETNKQAQAQPAIPRQKSATEQKSSLKLYVPRVEKTLPATVSEEEADILIIKATDWRRHLGWPGN